MNRILPFVFCFIALSSTAQSINPLTFQIGGGTYKSNSTEVDWSIAEGSSVQTFTGLGGVLVTSGILQPYTLKNEFVGYNGSTNWLATEIVAYPIPTRNILLVDFKIAESGRINLQLIDNLGIIHFAKSFDYTKTNGAQRIDLTLLPSGTYYLNAILSIPNLSITKRAGAFKIIKL